MRNIPFSKEQILALKETYPTPFYVYDGDAIAECVKNIQKAFSWNKGYKEYFAVKATPNPQIIGLLHKLGCGVDCASMSELTLAKRLGIVEKEIMFTSNDTPADEFRLANELGAIINFDDITHIEFLEKVDRIPETVCLRYNPGTDFIVQNDIMGELKESKFGMRPDQLIEGIKLLKEKGAKTFGVHAMLASCALDEDYYPTLAREVFLLALKIREETGVTLSFVDMAGGIGIPYRPEEKAVDIFRIGDNVRKVYEELLTANGIELSIFTEMGRYVTGPYGYLVSTVLHNKVTYKNYLGLDATACNLMRPAIYGAYHHIEILGKDETDETETYDVTGSLCENNDKFAVDRVLPKASEGDIAVICDSGAHGYSMGYNYNGKLRSAEFLLEKGDFRLIRRAETLDDYFATMIF